MSDTSKINLNFSKITALSNQKLALFTNTFFYHKNEYYYKNIGSLFGVIQISDHSKNSEYLPNLLTSTLKKSFYLNKHKTIEENFEFALKKVNLALADLAEHDIVEWNNNLHAIIGVFTKKTLLFTQVGNANIFLGRQKKIIPLSEENPKTSSHPIKTFCDVIVGEIKSKDKLIITTPAIYNIFQYSDLDRLFKTFSPKEFDNLFLKTIEREGENISALIVNIKKKKMKDYSKMTALNNDDLPIEKLTQNKNFLGGEINKSKQVKNSNSHKILEKEKEKISDYTPRIKKSTSIIEPTNVVHPKKEDVEKKSLTSNISSDKKNDTTPITKKTIKNLLPQSINNQKIEKVEKKEVREKEIIKKLEKSKKITKQAIIKNISSSTKNTNKKNITKKKTIQKLNDLKDSNNAAPKISMSPFEKTPEIYIKDDEPEKKAKKPPIKKLNKFFTTSENKIKSTDISKDNKHKKYIPNLNKIFHLINLSKNIFPDNITKIIFKTQKSLKKITNYDNYNANKIFNNLKNKFTTFKKIKFTKILLNFSKKKSFIFFKNKNFDSTTLIDLIKNYYIIIGIIFLLIIFIFTSATKNIHSKKDLAKGKSNPSTLNEKNKTTIENKNPTTKVALIPSPIELLDGNEDVLLIYTTNNKLYELKTENNKIKKIDCPSNINLSNIKSINYIASLNLFFISSDSQIISYSPMTKKLIKNKITFPQNFKFLSQDVYLSYLYLLNKSSKQIYRYPRDTGGFGTPKKWLKQPLPGDATKISAMAIDENVRIAYKNGTIEKYFGGKLKNTKKFKVSSLDFIKTNVNLKNYYILDKNEGKIIKINKETDKIEAIYQNSAIQNTNTFVINKKLNTIFLFTDKDILSIKL